MTAVKILTSATLLLLLLSISATFYRYIIIEDFIIETKPFEEFTEDDF